MPSLRRLRGPGTFLVAGALVAASCGSSPAAPSRPAASPTTRPPASTASPSSAPSTPTGLDATTEAWRLPAPVSRPVVVPYGPGFVILGGLAPGDVSTDRVVQVDPATGSAQAVGTLPLAVHDSAGAAIGGRAFAFAGGSFSTISTVQAWSAAGGAEVGHLPQPRSDLTAVTAGTTTYVLGGFNGSTMDADVLATSDGVTFRPVATLPVPVRYAAAAYADGALWVIGGVTSTSESGAAETTAIQRIDPASGRAAVVGHLPAPLGHATAVTLGGTVFVLGGRSASAPSAAIWRLQPAGATVVPAGHLPQAVSDAGSVVVGGTAYLVGGEVSGPTAPLDTVVALRPH